MNPNIYKFAHTEYAQDAFIAWMCSCYSESCTKYNRLVRLYAQEQYTKVE